MEVWVAYSFLNKNKFENIEDLFNKLPQSLVQSVNRYKNVDDRLGRMTSKILLEILVRKIFPHQNFFWELYKIDSFSKPYFDGLDVSFNASHTDGLVTVCAVRSGQCGIDTESIKPLDIDIYRDFLHPKESEWLTQQEDQLLSFYKIWVKKEAGLKASGLGITEELERIDAHQDSVLIRHQKYFTQSLDLSTDYITFIAASQRIGKVNLEECMF